MKGWLSIRWRALRRMSSNRKLPRQLLPLVLQPEKFSAHVKWAWTCAKHDHSWTPAVVDGRSFVKREYSSYEDYLNHQASKMRFLDMKDYDRRFRSELRSRLETTGVVRAGVSVLCLGARIGTEVKAFMDLGCFAVGIDLETRPKNPYVLYGDFHHLQFPNCSVDVVYTNSLDHIFDIKRVIGEIMRVLKPSGALIIDVSQGRNEGRFPGSHESFYWDKIDAIVPIFEAEGLRATKRSPIRYPWNGEQMIFVKTGPV